MFMPCGADNSDPAAMTGHIVGVDFTTDGLLDTRTVADPGNVPSLSSDLPLTVPATADTIRYAPNPGGVSGIDTDDERIWSARIEENRLTGARTLWCGQNIRTDATGVATYSGDRDSIRWYEIDVSGTLPSLIQAGTLYDSHASNPRFFYYPGIAMNGQGHMVFGASVSSPTERADIALVSRFSGDPLGSLRGSTTPYASAYAYYGGRWGDYSFSVVDPSDGMTVWSAQQYISQVNTWATRVIQLIAPPPATPSAVTPNTFSVGAGGVATVTGTVVNGSGFFDGGAGCAQHMSAAVGQGGVTVNSVAFTSPTSAKVSVIVGQTNQRYHDLTIVNPDGQQATMKRAIIVSNGPGP